MRYRVPEVQLGLLVYGETKYGRYILPVNGCRVDVEGEAMRLLGDVKHRY